MIFRKGWPLVIPLLFVSLITDAQPIRFSEFYDSNSGAGLLEAAVVLDNGHIMAAGSNLNFANESLSDAHHVVIDEEGVLVSEVAITFPGMTFNTQSLIRTTSGGIFTTGHHCDYTVESLGYCDFYFSRLDETGDTLFTRIIERPDTSDLLLNMVETRPNKIMLIGWTYDDTTDTDADILLITVDTLGNELNRVVYGGNHTDFVRSGAVVNGSGDVLLTGFTESFPNPSVGRTWIVRTDSVGNVHEHITFAGLAGNNSSGQEISALADGSFILSGAHTGSGGTKGLLMKLDANASSIWQKSVTRGTEGQAFWAARELADGSFVATGPTNVTNDGSQAGWLAKMDAFGDSIWTRVYNPSIGTDYLRNMMVMDNGDIVMVGFGRGANSTTQDGWILRVDSMGCEVENCFITGVEDELSIKNDELRIWPNPATTTFNVQVNVIGAKDMEVVIHDLMRKEVWRTAFPGLSFQGGELFGIDVSGWPNGIYMITVQDNNGHRFSERLVVQH